MIELRFSITQDDIKDYADVSGDYNPLHLDEKYAKEQGFSGNIAHGMLTMAKIWSVISASLLTPADFPEAYELAFLSPVHAGDPVILRIDAQATEFHIEGSCNGQTVVKGVILVKTTKDNTTFKGSN